MPARRTAHETAIILAVILKRSGQTRARLSTKTVKLASVRKTLRASFETELFEEMSSDFDWIMCDLATGGYGAIHAKTLEAAKSVTMKKWLSDDERKALRSGTVDLDALEEEASPEDDAADGEGDADG